MMATSMTTDPVSLGDVIMSSPSSAVAFEIEVAESLGSAFSIPKRVRRRLEQTVENKSKSPASLEDIEARLKEADSRRQQFHEWLANKAKPKKRTNQSCSLLSKEHAQRLEAKLYAAEKKRLELLAHEQRRLAKLHESRLAAKTEAQLRAEREREELGSRVESRVQQAEINRLALVEAEKQRRAAANERMAHSIMQRMTLEGKDRERIEALRNAICQKIAAAEEKRACLLEAEKNRAQAVVLQARKVARAVLSERELELRKKKEKLEDRLSRAKRQRAEYLRQKGGCSGACHNNGHKMFKHGDRLCRKLTRCWRQFQRSRKTTYALAEELSACGINQQSIMALPFEELAARITSSGTLRSVKALLARIESRLMLSVTDSSSVTKVDHLLKRLSPGHKKPGASSVNRSGKKSTSQVQNKVGKEVTKSEDKKPLERYPARVFLCAYMILGHPDAVFSGKGDREAALAEAAAKLLPEFEALISTVLDGPPSGLASSPPSTPDISAKKDSVSTPDHSPQNHIICHTPQRPFSSQLISFDNVWCSYLCRFVAWKVKDAQLLEEDLIRVACQLEVSMLQKCKVVPDEDGSDLSHDSQAIRKQVLEDQRLLRDRILHLTGKSGADKMDEALLAVRSKFLECRENGTSLPSPFALASPDDIVPEKNGADLSDVKPRSKVARRLFNSPSSSKSEDQKQLVEGTSESNVAAIALDPGSHFGISGVTNEHIVNEMMHDPKWQAEKPRMDLLNPAENNFIANIQAQIRTTMERAFWDGIAETLAKHPPDYSRIISLIGEVKQDLLNLIPEAWKQGLHESLDLELLSQVLESGSNDYGYLQHLLDYTLDVILRLGAPVRDTEAKTARQSLMESISVAMVSDGNARDAFVNALVKGLQFVFEQLQVLKQDISSTRLRSLASLIGGSSGVEYLRKAFADRYMVASKPDASCIRDIHEKLPRLSGWIMNTQSHLEEAKNEIERILATLPVSSRGNSTTLSPMFPMCTGTRVVANGGKNSIRVVSSTMSSDGESSGPADWNTKNVLIRVGLLSIVCGLDAAVVDNISETFDLNVARIRDLQNEFQKIVVTITSLLLVRQELVTKGVQGTNVEDVISSGVRRLGVLLNGPIVCVSQIGLLLGELCSEQLGTDVNSSAELMARVLERSLSPDDPVFARVSSVVQVSLRAILIFGKDFGLPVAESALRRIGGGYAVDKIVDVSGRIDRLAVISGQVHEPWYTCLVSSGM